MSFDKAFDLAIAAEGGYVNDPHDPGGETKYGISKRKYPGVDIKGLTVDGAKAIYKVDYWDVVRGDELPWPLSAFVFDTAVNQGCGPADNYVAEKLLQRALDTVQDGILGKTTMRLAKASRPWHWARFMAFRTMRYQSTRNYDRYGEGWLIRIFTLAMEVHDGT